MQFFVKPTLTLLACFLNCKLLCSTVYGDKDNENWGKGDMEWVELKRKKGRENWCRSVSNSGRLFFRGLVEESL